MVQYLKFIVEIVNLIVDNKKNTKPLTVHQCNFKQKHHIQHFNFQFGNKRKAFLCPPQKKVWKTLISLQFYKYHGKHFPDAWIIQFNLVKENGSL